MATPIFDPTKPVQQRNGRAARIIVTDLDNPAYPIVALTEQEDGRWWPETFTSEGHIYSDPLIGADDLINVPEQHTFFTPIRVTAGGNVKASTINPYRTAEEAARVTMDAVLKVIVEDGQVAAAEIVYRKIDSDA